MTANKPLDEAWKQEEDAMTSRPTKATKAQIKKSGYYLGFNECHDADTQYFLAVLEGLKYPLNHGMVASRLFNERIQAAIQEVKGLLPERQEQEIHHDVPTRNFVSGFNDCIHNLSNQELSLDRQAVLKILKELIVKQTGVFDFDDIVTTLQTNLKDILKVQK